MNADTIAARDAFLLQEMAWVRSLARRLLADDSQVDDVVQDAWIAARCQPATGIRGDFRAWLAVVVTNRVRRLLRTERRRTRREQAVAKQPVIASTLDVVERGAVYRDLTSAVMELVEPYRSAVLLRFLDGMSGEQIAARQGVSHDAARKRVSRGLQLLRDRLARSHRGGWAAWCAAWRSHLEEMPGAPVTIATPATPTMAIAAVVLVGVAASSTVFWHEASNVVPGPMAASTVSAVVPSTANDATRHFTRSAAPAPATDGRVWVVDDHGGPVDGIAVVALAAGEAVAQAIVESGVLAPMPASTDELLLAARGALPRRLPWPPGRDRIVFAERAIVGGHCAMPPGRRSAVQLRHDRRGAWSLGLGPAALAAMAELGHTPDATTVPLDATSRFRIVGLEATWSGSLVLEPGWSLRSPRGRARLGAGRELLLVMPMHEIAIEAFAPIRVHGSLLGVHSPIADVVVGVRRQAPYGPTWFGARSDEDGNFDVAISRPLGQSAESVDLVVRARSGDIALQRTFVVHPAADDVAVGAIDLGAPMRLLVHDERGQPIAGARLRVAGPLHTFDAGVADVHGIVDIPFVPADATHVLVAARGHRSHRASMEAAMHPLVLASGSGIDLEVVLRNGAAVARGALHVDISEVTNGAAPGASPTTRSGIELPATGHLELADLPPGALLRLRIHDALGSLVAEREVVAPTRGRIDRLEVMVDATPYTCRGRVVTSTGRGVQMAAVVVRRGPHRCWIETDADGVFEVGPLFAPVDAVTLEVRHLLFSPWRRESVRFSPGTEPLVAELLRSRVLQVHVRQPDGTPVAGATVRARTDGIDLPTREREAGVYVLDNAPDGPISIEARVAGGAVAKCTEADVETVELPALATLDFASILASGEPSQAIVAGITPVAGGDTTWLRFDDPRAPAHRRLPIVPGTYRIVLERRDGGTQQSARLSESIVRAGPGEILDLHF